ncbi:MarR family winged helix-turn-helix transcriptional regulator [Bartonella sp. LJL80]
MKHHEGENSNELNNPIGSLLGYQIRRISADDMARLGKSLMALDISTVAASVLIIICANDRVTQSDVGRCLGIQRANMAPLTTMLEAKGLVEKMPLDGRSSGLTATNQGRELCDRILMAMNKSDAVILDRLSAEEQAVFHQLLGKILA